MIIDIHDTISITEKDFEEYHLHWHASEGRFDDEFICKIYGHIDNAVKTAQFISNKQCKYISYPTVIKSWSEWENEHEGS